MSVLLLAASVSSFLAVVIYNRIICAKCKLLFFFKYKYVYEAILYYGSTYIDITLLL